MKQANSNRRFDSGAGWLLRRFARLHETAPVLSIACALALPQVFPHEAGNLAPDGAELAMVAAAVDAVPYRIGPWVAQDIPVPEAARRLLRPNAILSRRFLNLNDGMSVDLTIVHCADSRDMLGHYPPVCYPSNGWVATARFAGHSDVKHGATMDLHMNDLAIPTRVYGFSRTQGWASESHIRIFNFFILPGGTITPDIEDVGLRTNWLGAKVTGVAQIQILIDAGVPSARAAEAAGEVLEAAAGLFDSLGVDLP